MVLRPGVEPESPCGVMRAAVLHGPGDLRIEDVPVSEPGPGEVLLRVSTVGVCGSDFAEYDHGPVLTPLHDRHPVTGHHGSVILGHEFSGVVEDSRSDAFREGDLVACAGAVSCGTCRYCTSGRMSLCEGYWVVGLHQHGGLAQFCSVPASTCVSAGGLTPDAAALAQPMSIAAHAVRQSRLASGEHVIVIGVGGIGVFITHIAAARGATVVACDIDRDRLEIARRLGAEHTVHVVPDTDLMTELARLEIRGEVVFEVTGTVRGLAMADSSLVPGARLVIVGLQKESAEIQMRRLTLREHEIIGTNGLDIPSDLPGAVHLLAQAPELWSYVAPVVTTMDALVDAGLRSTREPPPIKTLASPEDQEERDSVMA